MSTMQQSDRRRLWRWNQWSGPEVLAALSRLFWEALLRRYREWAKSAGHAPSTVETGAITGVHRCGASLNVHVHFHLLCLDGIYVADGDTLRFEPAPAPTRAELESIVQRVYARVMKWLSRRGLLRRADDADASNAPPSQSPAEALASAGIQRGTLLTVRESGDGSPHDDAALAPPPPRRVTDAVTHERFNLHASVHLDALDDLGRERLCRYLCRPAFSLARLRMRRDGNVSYRVKKASRARVTERVMTPMEALALPAFEISWGARASPSVARTRRAPASVSSEGVQGERAGARRRKEHARQAARGTPASSRRRTRGLPP